MTNQSKLSVKALYSLNTVTDEQLFLAVINGLAANWAQNLVNKGVPEEAANLAAQFVYALRQAEGKGELEHDR